MNCISKTYSIQEEQIIKQLLEIIDKFNQLERMDEEIKRQLESIKKKVCNLLDKKEFCTKN